MKFERLSVSNLRAVRHFAVEDLGDFIVIAGANGSGKSCILDAIRLLKSVYGGYQVNEYHHWFGEFAINVQDRNSLRKFFRDPDRPITISASLRFADSERTYLLENAESVVQALA